MKKYFYEQSNRVRDVSEYVSEVVYQGRRKEDTGACRRSWISSSMRMFECAPSRLGSKLRLRYRIVDTRRAGLHLGNQGKEAVQFRARSFILYLEGCNRSRVLRCYGIARTIHVAAVSSEGRAADIEVQVDIGVSGVPLPDVFTVRN